MQHETDDSMNDRVRSLRVPWLHSVLALGVLAPSSADASESPARVTLQVLRVRQPEVRPSVQAAIADRIAQVAGDSNRFSVANEASVGVFLDFRDKQYDFCQTNASGRTSRCGLDVRGAFSGDLILAARLNSVGAGFDVRVVALEPATLREVDAVLERASTDDELELVRAAESAAKDLLYERPNFPLWPSIVTGGLAAGATTLGVIMLTQAIDASEDRAAASDPTSFDAAQADLEDNTTLANVGLGIGAGLGAVAVGLFVAHVSAGSSSGIDWSKTSIHLGRRSVEWRPRAPLTLRF